MGNAKSHRVNNHLRISSIGGPTSTSSSSLLSDAELISMKEEYYTSSSINASSLSTSKETFRILLGDFLREEDMVPCYPKEASSLAMDKLRVNDCAFIKRSDGLYTYSLYKGRVAVTEGNNKSNNSSSSLLLSFQVDEEGGIKSIKTFSVKQFSHRVKVPVHSPFLSLAERPKLGRSSRDRKVERMKVRLRLLENNNNNNNARSRTARRASSRAGSSIGGSVVVGAVTRRKSYPGKDDRV